LPLITCIVTFASNAKLKLLSRGQLLTCFIISYASDVVTQQVYVVFKEVES